VGEALKEIFRKQAERESVRLVYFLCAIVALHYLFFFFDWYAVFPGLDWLMHCISGAWVGAYGAWLLFSCGRLRAKSMLWEMIAILGFVALVGVLWEFHEFVADFFITDRSRMMQLSLGDTMGDLFFDMLGASITLTARHARFLWNSLSS
jgi:hypothetical protein